LSPTFKHLAIVVAQRQGACCHYLGDGAEAEDLGVLQVAHVFNGVREVLQGVQDL
jgi:hypothetical protein